MKHREDAKLKNVTWKERDEADYLGTGKRQVPHSISQLLILDLGAEEVRVRRLVAHGGRERAENRVQKLKDLVLVDALPAVLWRLAQRALHGHEEGGDVDEAAHLAEHRPGAVTLPQHLQQSLKKKQPGLLTKTFHCENKRLP